MGQAVVYSHPSGISNSAISSGSGGGNVEDILKRLGKVEESVGDLKTQVGVIAAAMPLLATAASVADVKLTTAASIAELKTEVRAMAATMPHLATAASVADVKLTTAASIAELKTEVRAMAAAIPHLATAASVSAMETRIIKWMVATALALTGLAFTIAKFVH
jgi:hypothetical protein